MALTDNLVSYWKLDGNSNDAVGSNNGTDTSISYNASYGKINQGALFGGSSKIDLPNGSIASSSSARSLEVWFYPTTDDFDTIFSVGAQINYQRFVTHINLPGTGQIYLDWGAVALVTNAACITKNAWNHLVITYAGGEINATTNKIYINGSPVASTISGSPSTAATSDSNIAIGWDRVYNTRYFTGYIDEVGTWSRALSSDEITTLYNSGNGLQYPFSGGGTPAFIPKVMIF